MAQCQKWLEKSKRTVRIGQPHMIEIWKADAGWCRVASTTRMIEHSARPLFEKGPAFAQKTYIDSGLHAVRPAVAAEYRPPGIEGLMDCPQLVEPHAGKRTPAI